MNEFAQALLVAVWFLLGAGTTAAYYFVIRPFLADSLDMDEAQINRIDAGLALLSAVGLGTALLAR